jgi:hypothetical protein
MTEGMERQAAPLRLGRPEEHVAALRPLLLTQRGFKTDCFTAQKTTGLFAMTEEGCHSIMKSAGAVEVLLMTRRGFKIDCFTAQKSTGPFAMTEEGCHSIMK